MKKKMPTYVCIHRQTNTHVQMWTQLRLLDKQIAMHRRDTNTQQDGPTQKQSIIQKKKQIDSQACD